MNTELCLHKVISVLHAQDIGHARVAICYPMGLIQTLHQTTSYPVKKKYLFIILSIVLCNLVSIKIIIIMLLLSFL